MKRALTSIVLIFGISLFGCTLASNPESDISSYERLDRTFQQNFSAFKIAKKKFPKEYDSFLKAIKDDKKFNETTLNKARMGNAFFNKLARTNKENLYNMTKKDIDIHFSLKIKFIKQVNEIEGSLKCSKYFSASATRNTGGRDFFLRHLDTIQEIKAKKIIYFSNKNETDLIPLNLPDIKFYLFELNSEYPEILPNNRNPNRNIIFCEKLVAFYKDLLDDKSKIGYQAKKLLFLIENNFTAKEIEAKYAATVE